MKPDWKDAPEWANYLAMDADGLWFWFKYEPYRAESEWQDYGGDVKLAFVSDNWQNSLEQRP